MGLCGGEKLSPERNSEHCGCSAGSNGGASAAVCVSGEGRSSHPVRLSSRAVPSDRDSSVEGRPPSGSGTHASVAAVQGEVEC